MFHFRKYRNFNVTFESIVIEILKEANTRGNI